MSTGTLGHRPKGMTVSEAAPTSLWSPHTGAPAKLPAPARQPLDPGWSLAAGALPGSRSGDVTLDRDSELAEQRLREKDDAHEAQAHGAEPDAGGRRHGAERDRDLK